MRTDWLPSDDLRRALRAPTGTSTNTLLAAAIRKLNFHLSRLPAEEVRDLMDDWSESWEALEEKLQRANDADAASYIETWRRGWLRRLSLANRSGEVTARRGGSSFLPLRSRRRDGATRLRGGEHGG